MDSNQLRAVIEGIIYVAEEPVTVRQLAKGLKDVPKEEIEDALQQLVEDSHAEHRGVEIRQVAGGYRMSTKAEHHEAVRAFVRTQRPPLRLTHQALVTLAVIAYRQPVTAPEIKAIRGVDPTGPIHTLLEKGLIETAGRKEVVGRPILYRTTRDFLLRFGLKDVRDLPTEKEFEELARASLGESAEMFLDENFGVAVDEQGAGELSAPAGDGEAAEPESSASSEAG